MIHPVPARVLTASPCPGDTVARALKRPHRLEGGRWRLRDRRRDDTCWKTTCASASMPSSDGSAWPRGGGRIRPS